MGTAGASPAPLLAPTTLPATGHSFGPWPINETEIFAHTALSFATVNLKPIVPGHTLIIPKRVVSSFLDLRPDEVADLWWLAQTVARHLQHHYHATASTFAIQDGPAAGQTVPHVHVHVLPRSEGQFERNDQVYDELLANEQALPGTLQVDADEVRSSKRRRNDGSEIIT